MKNFFKSKRGKIIACSALGLVAFIAIVVVVMRSIFFWGGVQNNCG